MDSVKLWVMLTLFGIALSIIAWLAKVITTAVNSRLDAMLAELKAIGEKLSESRGDIKNLQEKDVTTQNRLNDHAVRLRNLEINFGKFSNHQP